MNAPAPPPFHDQGNIFLLNPGLFMGERERDSSFPRSPQREEVTGACLKKIGADKGRGSCVCGCSNKNYHSDDFSFRFRIKYVVIPLFRGHSDHTRLPGLASVDDVTSFFLEAKNGETLVELSWETMT